MPKKILLVDDDALMRRSLGFNLEQAGFEVSAAASGENALAMAANDPPDLVLLDINLPGIDGMDTLKRFRQKLNSPVIFVTARRRELDQILGLELGADDYVTKPFDFDILLARVKAVLRRTAANGEAVERGILLLKSLQIDPLAHKVLYNDKPVELSPREFELLYVLARNANKVLSSDDLLALVWGAEYAGEPQVLYVHIRWLRQKLEPDPQKPRLIETIRGVGYRLNAEESS
jgi:DNA-binding response OmpR family regulator